MHYQSSEEVHKLLMSLGNRPHTLLCFEGEPLQPLCGTQWTLCCAGVSYFSLEFLQLLFNAEHKKRYITEIRELRTIKPYRGSKYKNKTHTKVTLTLVNLRHWMESRF